MISSSAVQQRSGAPQVTAAELRSAAVVDAAPAPLAEALELAVGRTGKGLRPALVFAAAECGPSPDAPEVRHAAMAIELLHLATLVHDDILDQPESRRGARTVASVHGSHAAAAAGAWLLSRFHDLVASCGPIALDHASDAAMRLCEGQMLDSRELFNTNRTPESYLTAITGKTAALFELSTRLGAYLAGADSITTERLATYGLHLGIAYQIVDDIHDLHDPDANDLRYGNYTLPVIYAIERDPGLAAQLTDPQYTPTIPHTDQTHQALTHHIDQAHTAIATLPNTTTLTTLTEPLLGSSSEPNGAIT